MIRARRPTPTDSQMLDQLVSTTLHAGRDDIGVRLEAGAAAAQLSRLPPEQARAVVLAVIGGNTAQEVADHEAIPLGTAKTRIRTGLRRMREALAVEMEVEVDHHD